jgi:hypothetical protein
MNRLNPNLILECLNELSDRELQESLWMGRIPDQQSSFEEAVEGLYTDSGLADELSKGTTGFSTEVETKLHELQRQLAKVQAKGEPTKVTNDPAMPSVRYLAAVIFELLKQEMK